MIAILPLLLVQQPKSLVHKVMSLLGKTRPSVERILGKPLSSSRRPEDDPYWDQWLYKGTPDHIVIWWNKAGKMTQMNLERRATVRDSLQLYDLKSKSLRVRKVPMENDPDNMHVLGVRNLPLGWNCYIHEHDLYFSRH